MSTNSSLPKISQKTGYDPHLPTKMGQLQQRFAAHIRDPEQHAAPGEIEDRRMGIYRQLFYNNIEGFISTGFPVIRKLFNEQDWHQLVRRFFSNYRCHTPLFPEIPREFIRFLEQNQTCKDKPFLLELAHYEWVEMALELDNSTLDMDKIDSNGDLLEGQPVLSPQAWLLHYQWPVHKISPDYQPTNQPQSPTFILINRSPSEKIEFTHLNQVSARLLELLNEENNASGISCLQQIATELGRENDPLVLQAGKDLLQDFRQQQIILGTYAASQTDRESK
ncbi:MAG: putative DNA-binding domain-containing protein [Xanthomonadales bacterium]|nr:putative DNA-binding domain-containing protein [Xanthomonadales bacterium]